MRRNGYFWTSGVNLDTTIRFPDPDFMSECKISAIWRRFPLKKKLFHLRKLYKERIRKDLLWRSVEYSGSWYECPRVLKLARFPVGGSKWFRACVGAHNLLNRSWSHLIHKFCYSDMTLDIGLAKTLHRPTSRKKALILLTSSTDKNPPHAGRASKRREIFTALAVTDSWESGRPWWSRSLSKYSLCAHCDKMNWMCESI